MVDGRFFGPGGPAAGPEQWGPWGEPGREIASSTLPSGSSQDPDLLLLRHRIGYPAVITHDRQLLLPVNGTFTSGMFGRKDDEPQRLVASGARYVKLAPDLRAASIRELEEDGKTQERSPWWVPADEHGKTIPGRGYRFGITSYVHSVRVDVAQTIPYVWPRDEPVTSMLVRRPLSDSARAFTDRILRRGSTLPELGKVILRFYT